MMEGGGGWLKRIMGLGFEGWWWIGSKWMKRKEEGKWMAGFVETT